MVRFWEYLKPRSPDFAVVLGLHCTAGSILVYLFEAFRLFPVAVRCTCQTFPFTVYLKHFLAFLLRFHVYKVDASPLFSVLLGKYITVGSFLSRLNDSDYVVALEMTRTLNRIRD